MIRLLKTVAVLLACASLARGQEWVSLGPDGGPAPFLARDPADASHAWVSTRTGVLRSSDGGRSWTPANDGLPGGSVTGVIARLPDGTLLVETSPDGLYRSPDGGSHWTAVGGVMAGIAIDSIAADPGHPATVYAAGPALFRSDDSGATWSRLPHPGNVYSPVAVDPTTSRIYAGYANTRDVNAGTAEACPYASADRGATWSRLGCYFRGSTVVVLGTPPLQAILADPRSPTTLYLAAADYRFVNEFHPGGVFRSDDGGATFQNLSAGLNTSVHSLAFGTAGELLAGTAGGLFVSRDRAQTWQRVTAFPVLAVADLVVGPGSEVLAGTPARGVYRSDDGGANWQASSRGLRGVSTQAIALDPQTPSTIWAGSADFGGGIAFSSDGGATWTDRPAFPSSLRVDAIGIDPTSPTRILAAASFDAPGIGPFSSLYGSSDAGSSWDARDGRAVIRGFAFDPLSPRRVLAGGLFLSGSHDSGETWTQLLTDSTGPPVFDPEHPLRAYTGSHWSADGGVTWVARTFPMPSVSGVAVGPGGVVYAATGSGVWRSDSFGLTFRPANFGIENRTVDALAVDLRRNVVYAGLQAFDSDPAAPNLVESRDGGTTWVAAAEGLPAGADVVTLAVDPTSGAAYAGTRGGVYRRIEAGGSCAGNAITLCLGGGRFRAQVSWTTGSEPVSAQAVPLTADAGAFWFFSDNNIELVVKVVDGTALNGKFWVFGAALTDVEYDLAVTDTTTGAVWTRHNPGGTLASFADTAAF